MESKLAENIRSCRKNLGFTQDQLAERLGVTLGAVSKWERGSSEPDLGYIMELAELFHVSVDALIGFSMHGNDADGEADRIDGLQRKLSLEELAEECDRALRRFPNHFRIVLCTAEAHKQIGFMHKKEDHVKRSLELYRHAVELISQNRDPDISEVYLRNEIAGCYSELKDYKKAEEEYKRNNQNGCNNAQIGEVMIEHENNPEEGVKYTDKAFLSQISEITTVVSSYIHYYLVSKDLERALRATEWEFGYLESLKADPGKRAYLDKIICLMILIRAMIRDRMGQAELAEEDLRESVRIARAFDADPIYTLENIIFAERVDKGAFYDAAGPTAVDGLKGTLDEAVTSFGDVVTEGFRKKFEQEIG